MITLAVFGLAQPALAAPSPDRAADPSDPSYIPFDGTLVATMGYEYSNSSSEAVTPATVRKSSSGQGNHFDQGLSFGINDDLNIGIGWRFGNTRSIGLVPARFIIHHKIVNQQVVTMVKVSPAKIGHTVARGADNPDFSVGYRIIEEDPFPVSIDIGGDYSPDVFEARAASQVSTGTLATGSQQGSANLAVTRGITLFNQDMSVRASGNAGLDSPSQFQDSDGVLKFRAGTHAHWSTGLSLFTDFTDRISGSISTGYNGATNDKWVNTANAKIVQNLTIPDDSQDITVSASYHLIQDRLLLSLAYHHGFGGSSAHFTERSRIGEIYHDSSKGLGSNDVSAHLIANIF